MEITQRLYTSMNNQEVTAVLLNDEGEEYPVFLESLHNTILFPVLLESGYKLESLPYGFVKDGVRFSQIPKKFYNLTPEVEERMYNSLGVKMPVEELKKHLSQEEVPTLETPDTNYTIFTREEFLDYLKAVDKYQLDEDYLPINYFVAPSARFSINEWMDKSNVKYINILDRRRQMSLSRFDKLVEFLKRNGLPANYKAIDIIDCYFAWGIDGMNFDPINKRRETRPFRLTPNPETSNTIPITEKSYGLVDSMGNLLIPMNQKHVNWKLANKNPDYVSNIASMLSAGSTYVVELRAPATQDVVILDSREVGVSLQFTSDKWVALRTSHPTILVESPERAGNYMSIEMALPNNREKLYKHCSLMALARKVFDIRRPRINVSSYQALTVAGCNPKAALQYIVMSAQMYREYETKDPNGKRPAAFEDEELPKISEIDIDDYLSGAMDDLTRYPEEKQKAKENIRTFLASVIAGDVNIDLIKTAKEEESRYDLANIYSQLFAVHNVMGISIKQIYEQLNGLDPRATSIRFSSGNSHYDLDVSPLRLSYNAYNRDLESYDFQAARDCSFFTYVLRVAREVGMENCRRHVGFEFMMVNKTNKKVKEVLSWLHDAYVERVSIKVSDSNARAKWDKLIDIFCLSRYFEIAFKATITWPGPLGGDVQPAMPSHVTIAKNSMEYRVENTVAYCDFTVSMKNMNTMQFSSYCTNAYITPEYVIPRSNDATIREIPFYTAWYNYKDGSPQTFAALVNMGCIPADFVNWDGTYFTNQFVQRGLNCKDAIDSLEFYYNRAIEEVQEYPDDLAFTSVQHPISYMYPGLHNPEDNREMRQMMDTPRDGSPVIRLGVFRDIKKDDYLDKIRPDNPVTVKESYIRPFVGFDATCLLTIDNVISKLPSMTTDCLTVMPRSESVYVPYLNKVMHFSHIKELDLEKCGIVHIYDRNYILRGSDNSLWEVRI